MATKKSKKDLNCGQVVRSWRKGKKIAKKYCTNGKEKIVHAGATGYKHNYSPEARKNFRSRHNCSEAKTATPKHLACTKLWSRGGRKKTSADKSKRKS